MENILICDDDKEIVDVIDLYLSEEGFRVFRAYDGIDALELMKDVRVHLAIVDVMMPNMDGIRLVKEIRKTSAIPIIFLSAKSEDADKILGLNLGADDYMTKPFNPLELIARVNSNLRRYMSLGADTCVSGVYSTGGLVLDENNKECTVYGDSIRLTPLEYNILLLLVKNKGKVMSIGQIYENIWHIDSDFRNEQTIAVHIRHIREKIEVNPKEPRFLKVVWGVGYKVEEID
ncbi:MAG: response regulator transcription factor [Butyrivibrio sp.]|nr:response regulator transcription factor [Butyrivibrio sp.]